MPMHKRGYCPLFAGNTLSCRWMHSILAQVPAFTPHPSTCNPKPPVSANVQARILPATLSGRWMHSIFSPVTAAAPCPPPQVSLPFAGEDSRLPLPSHRPYPTYQWATCAPAALNLSPTPVPHASLPLPKSFAVCLSYVSHSLHPFLAVIPYAGRSAPGHALLPHGSPQARSLRQDQVPRQGVRRGAHS
jgi:hypothetical protein